MPSSPERAPRTGRLPAVRFFEVPERHREAARAWLERGAGIPGSTPVPAAAVVFVRDGEHGVETLLTHRTGSSSLGPVGFPGGPVEAHDDDPLDWAGPTPLEWTRRLGTDDVGRARRAVVAAARKAFEEVGVLLAGPDPMSTVESVEGAEWLRSREALALGDVSLADVLGRRRLVLRSDLLRPLAHWVSSDFVHRRHDVHYFTAVVPDGQTASLLGSRGTWCGWVDAARAVADPHGTWLGDLVGRPDTLGRPPAELLAPGSLVALESLAECSSAIAFLAKKRRIATLNPVLEEHGGRPVLRLDLG
ncbi:NUDIX hydrolase [Kocuria flava]|uniref:NUDIX hydrolase n=1 Tax=Kocuria flava TaxID=446860 RepID=A0ABQ0X0R0_9MICC|nr:NUDIX hydrolase [Kocuria flava]GEO90795.1 NUDIX hydrolase [Kocuria flava]